MIEVIAIIVIIAIVGSALGYIIYQKKKGAHCIGCPYAGNCAKHDEGKGCH